MSGDADATDFGGAIPSGQVSFAAGQSTATITVEATGDLDVENDEAFTVTLSNANNATISQPTASSVIVNDDVSLSIQATNAVQAEGDNGTTAYTFTVTRTGDTDQATTVDWNVSGDVNAADFGGTLPGDTLTFAAGETSKTITLNVSGDLDVEGDEAFSVTLSKPFGQRADRHGRGFRPHRQRRRRPEHRGGFREPGRGRQRHHGLHLHRDPHRGPDPGHHGGLERVGRRGRNGLRRRDSVRPGELRGGPEHGDHHRGGHGRPGRGERRSLHGHPVQCKQRHHLPAHGEQRHRQRRRVPCPSRPTNAVQAEGDNGTTAYTFTVTRTGDTDQATTVDWNVSGDVNAADFGGTLPGDTLTFAAGETSKTITLNVSGDLDVEGDEAFSVTLSNPSGNAQIGTGAASGLIVNDDADLSIAADSVSRAEGDNGTTAFTFTVTRTGDLTQATTADWSVSGDADATDFGGVIPSGQVSFRGGPEHGDHHRGGHGRPGRGERRSLHGHPVQCKQRHHFPAHGEQRHRQRRRVPVHPGDQRGTGRG